MGPPRKEGNVYLTTHSTHFIYCYMASDIWLRIILILKKETRCRHMGYSFRLTARVLLYANSHRQDCTCHDLCYTSRGALAGTRNSTMGRPMKDRSNDPSHHERTLLPRSYISLLGPTKCRGPLKAGAHATFLWAVDVVGPTEARNLRALPLVNTTLFVVTYKTRYINRFLLSRFNNTAPC